MKTVILCGGKGLRIRDLSDILPKPMIKIGYYPILHHIMNIYSKYNQNNFVLCLGYKSEVIIDYFKNLKYQNPKSQDQNIFFDYSKKTEKIFIPKNISKWKVQMAYTGLESNTGYRIFKIKKYIKDKMFFLTYGDGVGKINIDKLLKFHKSHNKIATLTSVKPPSRFGEIVTKDNKVQFFSEKPQVDAGRINGGFFVCDKKIFEYLSGCKENCSFEHDILTKLSKDAQLMSYDHKDFWMPMDTNREYELLNKLWKKNPKTFL